MTDKVIAAIKNILGRGERVELLKGPDGKIKVLRIRRETVPVGAVYPAKKNRIMVDEAAGDSEKLKSGEAPMTEHYRQNVHDIDQALLKLPTYHCVSVCSE